jgi:polyisoprenoid-binding protein YceI
VSEQFPTEWEFDVGHSTFEFSVRHMRVSIVKGAFNKITGGIHYDPENWTSSRVWAEIDVSSIDTHDAGRDEHLRGERFFDIEHYPTASFESDTIRITDDGRLAVAGVLTVKGESRPVTFDVEFQGVQEQPDGRLRAAFHAFATINRSDYGFPLGAELPGGGFVHSDEVQLAMYASCRPVPAA